MNISEIIARELEVKIEQVTAAITLLNEGATVPFISRYRKELTGSLNDTQLRFLEERLNYLRELEDRRQTILKSIAEQDKLTDELASAIHAADNKSTLEDLYLPYKPKRRTKAQIAKEAGLEPLAMQLLQEPNLDPYVLAKQFIDPEKNITNETECLEGARHILMELFAEDPQLNGEFREYVWEYGVLKSEIIKGKETEGNKFADYFQYEEAIKKIPSHRALALLRGQREEILRIALTLNEDQIAQCTQKLCQRFEVQALQRPADEWLFETVSWTWRIKLFLKVELELMMRLREMAEEEAIKVFANNLKHLLMAAPAGSRVTMGLDPGFRTGVKAVVISETGKLLAQRTIFPHAPQNEWGKALKDLAELCKTYHVALISIGNGTASRETDKLVNDLKKQHPALSLMSVMTSEAGASVYSASELAAQEFPDLDVTYRGAVSIARRLQDPLAELVKIEPKAIGVGQYQHDVNQVKLSRTLRAVMEDCVNAVGVDVNTASVPLLTCVAGLNESVAKNIIHFRDENGPFRNRQTLKKVPRLGDKAFEQAAGFLRIVNGDNPLDASAVHPESYAVVEKILAFEAKPIAEMMGNVKLLQQLRPSQFVNDQFGLPTVTDIIHELEKPGRDPRPEFKTAVFKEDVASLSDLKSGMVLEGVVTNVANFGAFVDIGVHQDGLVHVSMLANHFVKDPHQVVKVGDIVKVKVLEVDVVRKRIQLTMRLQETSLSPTAASVKPSASREKKTQSQPLEATLGSALLAALRKK